MSKIVSVNRTVKWGLIFGFLQSSIFALTIYFWDFYAGSATLGFGIMGEPGGIGMFWIYMVSLFNSLIVLLAIYKGEKFGIGVIVYLPYAIIGFFVEAYYELWKTPVLINIWCVLGWCVFGLLSGLSADFSYKVLREKTKLKQSYIAGLTGLLMSLVYWVTTWIALEFFYKTKQTGPGSFLGVTYFCLPWMLLNAFLGGYLAYAHSGPKTS